MMISTMPMRRIQRRMGPRFDDVDASSDGSTKGAGVTGRSRVGGSGDIRGVRSVLVVDDPDLPETISEPPSAVHDNRTAYCSERVSSTRSSSLSGCTRPAS